MWNNYTLVAEMLGAFVLVFGVLATIKTANAKTFNLTGVAKNLFVALGVAISLMLAVYLGEMKFTQGFSRKTQGWINPAVALMVSTAAKDFDYFFPAIVGELIGGFAAILIGWMIFSVTKVEQNPVVLPAKIEIKKSLLGEIAGSSIFLGGIAIAAISGALGSANFSGLIVGFSVFVALATFGNNFALLLNPMVGISLMIGDAFNKGVNKVYAANFALSLVANLSVAAVIGGVYYGLSQM